MSTVELNPQGIRELSLEETNKVNGGIAVCTVIAIAIFIAAVVVVVTTHEPVKHYN